MSCAHVTLVGRDKDSIGATFPIYSPVTSLSELAISGSSGLAKPQTDPCTGCHVRGGCSRCVVSRSLLFPGALPGKVLVRVLTIPPKLQTLYLQLTHGICIVHPCRTLSPMTDLIGLLLGLDGSPTPGCGVQQHLYPVYMIRPYDLFIPGIALWRGPEQVRWGAGVTRAGSAKRPSWRNLLARSAEHWFLLPITVNQQA